MHESTEMMKKRKGFTLLEVLLSVAVIGILAGIGTPVYQSFQNRNELDIAATTFAQALRRAQVLSQAVAGDTTWGVEAHSGSITLFKGATYVARDAAFDEIFQVPTSIVFSGTSEYVFSKFTGSPQTTGILTITSANNEIRNITINTKGTVSY